MPGFAPFAPSLRLPAYLCRNCGFWQRYFSEPPNCPLCLDSRHVVPWQGWSFATVAEAQAMFPMHWEMLAPGVVRFWNDPVDGIGSHSYLLTTAEGNLLFEGATIYSEAALAEIGKLGGVQFASASHPHTYGALFQIQDVFDPEILLHPADFAWSSALRVTRPFDTCWEPLAGLTLHHTGVHFAGHSVLHDNTRKILFCGDAMKFELSPRDSREAMAVSSHKAFVRSVPLTRDEAKRYLEIFAPLDFATTCTPFEQVTNFGTEETIKLFRRFSTNTPSPDPVGVEALSLPTEESTC